MNNGQAARSGLDLANAKAAMLEAHLVAALGLYPCLSAGMWPMMNATATATTMPRTISFASARDDGTRSEAFTYAP